MFPGKKNFLQKAMRKALSILGTSYNYIVINADPQNPLSELYPLTTNIFPNKDGNFNVSYFAYDPNET